MNVNLECQDGTKILSDVSEINKLLEEGWSIVESGVVKFNVNSVDFDLSPYEIAYRLKKDVSTKLYELPWKDNQTRETLPMTFDFVEPVIQGFCRIKNTIYKQEMKKLIAEGWILLKECKMHASSNTNVYSLGQTDD